MISVAIPSLNFCGGAEAVTLSLIKLLKERDYNVRLITADRPNWNKVKTILGDYTQPDEEKFAINNDLTTKTNIINNIKLLMIFSKLLYNIKQNRDFIINMYGEFDLSLNFADVSYINSIPMSLRRTNNIFKNIILKAYNYRKRSIITNSYALAISNSQYMHHILINKMKMDTIVIHPPIVFRHIKTTNKDDIILTVARISPDKELEKIVYIADKLRKNYKFVIIGRIYDIQYYKRLSNLIDKLSLNEVVTLLPNKPRSVILDYLSRSKILLHTMNNEGYGLSIVEGMLAGCIPIVPRNGGPWIDILTSKDGTYGFSYKELEDASKYIAMLMNDSKLLQDIKQRAIIHAKELANEFYIKFPKLLESILSSYKTV